MNKIAQSLQESYQSKSEQYFQANRSEMLEYIPKTVATVLEVGCGQGNFGKLLKEEYFVEVWGVELDEQSASIAEQEMDKVLCGAFDESLGLPHNKFDCIVFNDVLEHLVDPFSALLHCKSLLREPGIIVASIPNVRYFYNIVDLLICGNWEYKDEGILDRTHLRFFTRRSILSMFKDLGFEVEEIKGINPVAKMSLPGRLRYLNWTIHLLKSKIEDMKYLQFVVVASPGKIASNENNLSSANNDGI